MKRLRNAHYYQETLVFIRERSVMYISAIGVRNGGRAAVREYVGESNRVTREPTHTHTPRATKVGVTLSVERSRPVTHADGVKWKSSTHTTPRPTTDSTPR